MKKFAKFIGQEDGLKTGRVYIVNIKESKKTIAGIRLDLSGVYKFEYGNYEDFTKEWEII